MSTKKKTPEELAAEKLAAEALAAEQAGDKVVDTSATEGETAQPADVVAETPAVDNAPETATADTFEPILGEIYEYQNQVGTLQNMFTGQEFAAGVWERAEHDNFLAGQIQAGRLKIRP